jgi:hypothetical protein
MHHLKVGPAGQDWLGVKAVENVKGRTGVAATDHSLRDDHL